MIIYRLELVQQYVIVFQRVEMGQFEKVLQEMKDDHRDNHHGIIVYTMDRRNDFSVDDFHRFVIYLEEMAFDIHNLLQR